MVDRAGRTRPPVLAAGLCPNLNLLERVWHFLKQKLACHRFWADQEGLRQAAITRLDQTEAHFHVPKRPAIRLVHNFCQSA